MREIERPDIVAVFEHYDLRIIGRGGTWQKAECPSPDHMDTNPSASINEETGKWNCFSCGRSGDGLDIVMERENLAGVLDAQRWCKERFGAGNGPVREGPVHGAGLPLRSGNRGRGGGAFVPPWRRGL